MNIHSLRRNGALLLPLLLVNSAAVYGQAGWAHEHLVNNWAIAALFAASVESIGIYLAYEAHSALMAGDASARLRLGSYLIGLLAGTLNYAHFALAPHYQPTPLAVTFGVLSSISPWLWSIRSRSMNRAHLRELGHIDPRAVRFSILRWALFPVSTARVFRGAVWAGVVQPAEAVALFGDRRGGQPAPVQASAAIDPPAAPAITSEPTPVSDTDHDAEDFDDLRLAVFGTPREITDNPAFVSDTESDSDSQDDQPKRSRRRPTTAEKIQQVRKRDPKLPIKDIAAKVGVSDRTVSRHLNPPATKTASAATPELAMSDSGPVNGHDHTTD